MRKFLVLLSAFCMIAFVGCKKDELEPAAEESEGIDLPEGHTDEWIAAELEEGELEMFDDLFPYEDAEVDEMIAMLTDEALQEYMENMPFQSKYQPMRAVKTRAGDGGGLGVSDVIEGVFDFVGGILGSVFTTKFVNSGFTNESAMIMALMCGTEESVLMLHQVLAQLQVMDQKLDHITNMVGRINEKITNQILNEGVDKIQKVIQDRNNRLNDAAENQKKYWRLMAMSIGMIDANDQKTPGYNAEAMLQLSDPNISKQDSVTLAKDSLVRNRLELFHHYLTKWYKECENKGYRAEDLVKYMTRANTGFSYPWTAAYSGVAITAVPWENEAGKVVNALRAEDAAVLGVQVVMEALYCITSRSKYITGKNIPENLLRTEIYDIRENLNILKAFYAKHDPLNEKTMAIGARNRCTIPGCQLQFVVTDDIYNNVTRCQTDFRVLINKIGEARYPGNTRWNDVWDGTRDIQWYAFNEAIKQWKDLNLHKNEFNRDTCVMLTLREVRSFNDYFVNKAKEENQPAYNTPFVKAVTSHFYPNDSSKRLWEDVIYVYPDTMWENRYEQVRGVTASSMGLSDKTPVSGTMFSGYADFMTCAFGYDFDEYWFGMFRCHYHGGDNYAWRRKRQYFYNETTGSYAHWQSEGTGYAGCNEHNCNCPWTWKNLNVDIIKPKDVRYGVRYAMPSPKFRRYDIREAVINAANAAYKAIRTAEQNEQTGK